MRLHTLLCLLFFGADALHASHILMYTATNNPNRCGRRIQCVSTEMLCSTKPINIGSNRVTHYCSVETHCHASHIQYKTYLSQSLRETHSNASLRELLCLSIPDRQSWHSPSLVGVAESRGGSLINKQTTPPCGHPAKGAEECQLIQETHSNASLQTEHLYSVTTCKSSFLKFKTSGLCTRSDI